MMHPNGTDLLILILGLNSAGNIIFSLRLPNLGLKKLYFNKFNINKNRFK